MPSARSTSSADTTTNEDLSSAAQPTVNGSLEESRPAKSWASEASGEESFYFHDLPHTDNATATAPRPPVLLTPGGLQDALKKLGVSPIDDIEEANLIMDNGSVIHFYHPKVQTPTSPSTYVVSGHSECTMPFGAGT